MKKIKCPICQKELEQDSIQCPYCKYRFKIVPKRVNSPEDNKMRLDGYLVSDIRDCLVHTEEDTLERFRKAQNKPEFNPSAGFGGNLWFAKRGMFDISLWLIVLNMTAVPLMAAAYGWMHKGSRSLPPYYAGVGILSFGKNSGPDVLETHQGSSRFSWV